MGSQTERRRFGRAPGSCTGPTQAASVDRISLQGGVPGYMNASHQVVSHCSAHNLLTPPKCRSLDRNAPKGTPPHRMIFGNPPATLSKQDMLARSAVGVVYRTFSPKTCLSPCATAQRALFVDAVQHKQSQKLGLISNSALRRGAAPVRPALAVGRLSTPSVKLGKGHNNEDSAEKRCLPQTVAPIPRHHFPPAWHPLHRLVFSTACTREKLRFHFSHHLLVPLSPERPRRTSSVHQAAMSSSSCTGCAQAHFLSSHEQPSTPEVSHNQVQCSQQENTGPPATSCATPMCHLQSDEIISCWECCSETKTGADVHSKGFSGSCSQGQLRPSVHALPMSGLAFVAVASVPEGIECEIENMVLDQVGSEQEVNVQHFHAPHNPDGTDATMDPPCIPPGAKNDVCHDVAPHSGRCLPTFTSKWDRERPRSVNVASTVCDHGPAGYSRDHVLNGDSDGSVTVHSPLGTCGPPVQCAALTSSACIVPGQCNAPCAKLNCDADADDASTFTDSMSSSSDDKCSSPEIDWSEPMESSGPQEMVSSEVVDDALTITVQQTSLKAVPVLASHPLSLTNRSSVSPDIFIPNTVQTMAPDSCPHYEQALSISGLGSGLDDTCMDMGDEARLNPNNECTLCQASPCIPDMNDRLVDGRRILGNQYVVEKVVGEGAYGVVMKCHLLRDKTQHVAIKVFKIAESDSDAEDVKRTAHREAALLQKLRHENITSLLNTFLIQDKLCICMEFSPRTLLELLEATNNGNGLDPDLVKKIIFQTLSAITFLHSQGVVFRDVKPENVLIDDNLNIKLCDFGFARLIPPDIAAPGGTLTDYVATRWYRAPELLLGGTHQQDGYKWRPQYGKPVDVWSVGCLMAELLTGQPLFPGESDLDQLYKIMSLVGPLTDDHRLLFQKNPSNADITFRIKSSTTLRCHFENQVPEDALSFMEGLLNMDPAKRLSGKDIFTHPYLHCMLQKGQTPSATDV